MNEVQKQDIWDTKHHFRNSVNKIILEENKQSDSMDQLEGKVLERVKEWIKVTRPRW